MVNPLEPFVSPALFRPDSLGQEGQRPAWNPHAVTVIVSRTWQGRLCVAPITAKVFTVLGVQLQLIWSASKQLILFQGYWLSVNIFQKMQADGITGKAIVLVCHETEQHLESIQKLPSNRINAEPVCLTEITTSTNKILHIFKRLLRCLNLYGNFKHMSFP